MNYHLVVTYMSYINNNNPAEFALTFLTKSNQNLKFSKMNERERKEKKNRTWILRFVVRRIGRRRRSCGFSRHGHLPLTSTHPEIEKPRENKRKWEKMKENLYKNWRMMGKKKLIRWRRRWWELDVWSVRVWVCYFFAHPEALWFSCGLIMTPKILTHHPTDNVESNWACKVGRGSWV